MSQQRLENMKKEYEAYPVPEEAIERIKAGIAQAEKEEKGMNKKTGRKGFYQFGKTIGLTAAAAMAALVLLANSSADIAMAMEKIPVIGAITKVVTFRNYNDKNGNFEANVEIPQISDVENENNESLLGINQTIEEYADKLIAMYEHDLRESEGQGNYALDSSYEIIRDDEKYLSIRINSVVVMASGNQFVKIFNVDKESGTLLTLTDLLKEDSETVAKINENIIAQMKEQMEADEMLTYFIKTEEDEFGFETVSEETNFYLNEKGELVIVFDEYEVAPGSMGVVEFTIPKDVAAVSE